ncbi:sulfite oxidase heme-binding subunit YedZ [Celerinatantimonas sp. YJH-8]|uniref:sulfite oxidase heme-binding subunit YedZ n=1 Tax=Celerinatantimonas sp. YJH-8 TaxID=3228714 RepID=UPI0038C043A3
MKIPVRIRRWLIFVLGILPVIWLVGGALSQSLGADPAQTLVHESGFWALRFLLMTLCVSFGARYFKWSWLMLHRRMLGLFTLFYALLHLLAYYLFILGSDLHRLGDELLQRPYIWMGIPAVVILVVLGLTSTNGWMRRLKRNWQRLHYLVYPALLFSWLHLFWQVRSSYQQAVIYGVIGAVLLGSRVVWMVQKRFRRRLKKARK